MDFTLERVLRELARVQINAGVMTLEGGGMSVWIGELADPLARVTFHQLDKRAVRDWPEHDAAAQWLHETALRLFPASLYARHAIERHLDAAMTERLSARSLLVGRSVTNIRILDRRTMISRP